MELRRGFGGASIELLKAEYGWGGDRDALQVNPKILSPNFFMPNSIMIVLLPICPSNRGHVPVMW